MDDFFGKPVSRRKLTEIIDKYVTMGTSAQRAS